MAPRRRLFAFVLAALVCAGGCYRIPLRMSVNDATGYEDVGVPIIEAVEYTIAGPQLRVRFDAAAFVSVIVLDRGGAPTLQSDHSNGESVYAAVGVQRFSIAAPVPKQLLPEITRALRIHNDRHRSSLLAAMQQDMQVPLVPTVAGRNTVSQSTEAAMQRRASARARAEAGELDPQVIVIVTERALRFDVLRRRLPSVVLDGAAMVRDLIDVTESGRWLAVSAPLRGM
jgi:hypothetical protein